MGIEHPLSTGVSLNLRSCVVRVKRPSKWLIIVLAATGILSASTKSTENLQPTNDLPNPYKRLAPWGTLPDRRTWGAVSAVAIDGDGKSVWVANRCGENPDAPLADSQFQYDSCSGAIVPP